MENNILKIDLPKEHVIAYLDLLGTASKIDKDNNYQYFGRLYMIYKSAIHIIQDIPSAKSYYGKIITKIFSDNIIMAIPLDSNDDIENIRHLIQFAAIVQGLATIFYFWPVRGGVTIGSLFLDEIMVWGKGLIRAYNIENQIALFPRIVVDQNIIQKIGHNNEFIRRDFDGLFFVDFLNFTHSRDKQGSDRLAAHIKDSFAKQLEEIKGQSGIHRERSCQKLQWYKNYLNQWYKEHYTPADGAVLIDESTFDENGSKQKQDPS